MGPWAENILGTIEKNNLQLTITKSYISDFNDDMTKLYLFKLPLDRHHVEPSNGIMNLLRHFIFLKEIQISIFMSFTCAANL